MTSSPHAFITGGSGFLGINLVRFLLNKGYRITSYDIADFSYPERDRINTLKADIRDRDTLYDSMKDVDVIIHCAAALPSYAVEDIFTTDIDGTRNVLDAAVYHKIPRVIHISTTAVYGIPSGVPIRESDPVHGIGPYGIAKVEAEKVCEEFRTRGLLIPILRPISFIGPERLGVFAIFYDWAKEGRGFPLLGSGRNHMQFLDVEDLCNVIYTCMTGEGTVVNDVFNIGAKEFTTMKEDYQIVLDEAGFGKKIVSVPATPAILVLRFLEWLHMSPLYKWVYETSVKDFYVSIEKTQKKLGFQPRYSNKDALLRNYRWYLAHADGFGNAFGISHRVPWRQGALGIIKLFF